MADPILRVERLRKIYGELVAVDDVDFSIPEGGSLGLVGESGSGKTTVARMIAGLTTPTAGTIVCCGRDRSQPARSARERRWRGREAQIVFQDPYSSLDRRQSVEGALLEVLRLHAGGTADARRARARELAELVGLAERELRARPSALSGGQRQRVAIARALAASPRLVILDESVAALDVSIQAQVLNLLADIRTRSGVSYLLISHDLAVIRQLTDETVVMFRGSIVERGNTARLLDDPQTEYAQLLRASVPGPGWKPVRREASRAPAAGANGGLAPSRARSRLGLVGHLLHDRKGGSR